MTSAARRLSVPIALAVSAVVATGCADARSGVAAAPYKQAAVEKCLRAEEVVFIPVRRTQLDHRLLAEFPGVTGTIGIPQGGGKTSSGYVVPGATINSGTLIFDTTAARARRDRSGLYTITHQPWMSPLDPPAPAPFIPSLQSTRGNVVILWDYSSSWHGHLPAKSLGSSMKLLAKCLPAQR